MAGTHGKDRMAPEISHIFVFVNILNVIFPCVATVESHGQAFIQTDNELRYMGEHIDGVPLHISGHNIQDIGIQDGSATSGRIRFDPAMLDFREQPMGMPHMEQVTVHNPDPQTSLHLLSISGSTLHFHCSFFQDKMVPPGGNTTFDVVFLARQVGAVENTLYIHTTQGSFKYQVVGVGVPNPYRIRPFLGAKVPLNSSFSPLIRMHNPHSSPLQVVEMYSSGGDLHLELPTGEKEAPKNLWEIPPFETKPVMRASFVGRIENNHTAFIRIKTNRDQKDEVLILPVEVEVTSTPGIFSPLEMLDFGIMRTLDAPKTLRLNLLNSGSKPVHISGISVSPPNEAISIEFRPVKLQPDILQTTPVALISYTALKGVQSKQWHGKIVVKSKNGQYKVAIPYQVSVLHGSLVYDKNKTMFYTGQPPFKNVTRHLAVTNTFNFTVVIYNVSLPKDGQRYFSIGNMSSPLMMKPRETLTAFHLLFHPNTSHLHLATELRLATNASVFNIPIVVYNGKLKVVHHRPEIFKGQLDFGTMGVEERRSMTFTLRNDNPVDIIIREFGANMEKTSVELLGIEKGNGTTLTRKQNVSEIDTNPLVLKPYHFAVFSVNLVAPNWEGKFAAEVVIVTQFENLYIPLTLRTAEGSLNAVPDKVVFEKCFPGKMPYQELKMHSSFDNVMEVRHVTFQPNDTRFYYVPPAQGKATRLEPHRDNMIGKIFFDPKKECREDCYVGLPTYIPAGHQWLLGATLDRDVADTDQYLYMRFQHKWQQLGHQQLSTINVTIQLDTNQVRGFLFPAQAHLHWPSLTKKSKIKFPLTQIGNLSVADLTVENPAGVPVLVQVLALSLYPNPQTIVDLVSPKLSSDLSDFIEMDDLEVFTLQDLEQFTHTPTSTTTEMRKAVENSLGVKPHRQTVTMMLEGSRKATVRIGFTPKDDLSRTSLIIIRNNLTIIDTIIVQGQGGRGEIRFNNKKAGSQTPLLFDMTEKHLKSCDKKKQSKSTPPSFTVKRTFTARNTGQLPFYVHGFSINDSPCEGYGFKVLDCQGFELQPNASRKVDIAFTPDFTMSRMRRTLSVSTSLGPSINYTLEASIPSHMLTKCASALPRPLWEPILYYSTVCIMAFLLFCILVASYFEADRIFTADILKRRSKMCVTQTAFEKGRVFDLKTIAGVRPQAAPAAAAALASQDVPTVPAQQKSPVHDVSNGHVDLQMKRKTSNGFWFFNLLKSLFTKRPHNMGPARPVAERQNSREKEIRYHSSSNNIKHNSAIEKQGPSNDISTSNDNKVPTGLKVTTKKSKAAKRQNTDLTNFMDFSGTNDNPSNKKQGNHHNLVANSNPSNQGPVHHRDLLPSLGGSGVHRRVSDADHKNLADKDHRFPLDMSRLTGGPSLVSKRTERVSMHQLDVIEAPEVSLISEDLEESAKKEALKRLRQRKSKKIEAREGRLSKECFRQHELLIDNDKDDTSSTTTESSSAEADDKTSSARESTPEPPAYKKKTRVRKEKKRIELEDEDNNDEEFVITSKSKAHKKIKVDPKNAFGGNIHRPSTLELPYTTRLEAAKGTANDLAMATSLERAVKKTMKIKSTTKAKTNAEASVAPLRSDTDSSDRGTESPPPVWDMPKCSSSPPEGDLSELSLQTEVFAAKHSKPIIGSSVTPAVSTRGHSPEPLTASSRSSSYSSVVSSGSTEPARNGKGPKFGMFGVEGNSGAVSGVKKPTGNFSGALSELKHPGAIGTRALPPKVPMAPVTASGAASGLRKNPWTAMAGSPTTPDNMGYNLHPIQEAQHPMMAAQPEPDIIKANYAKPASSFECPDGLGQFNIGSGAYKPPVTMMQRLHMERRKRLMDYQQRLVQGEDWPGFNMAMQHSFWDSTGPSVEPWSTLSNSPPRAQMAPALWDCPASGAWTNPAPSIWSTNTNSPPPETMLSSAAAAAAADAPVSSSPPQGTVGNFDPFNTLGSIWRPNTAGHGGTTWGFPPKPEEDPN